MILWLLDNEKYVLLLYHLNKKTTHPEGWMAKKNER